MHPRVSSIVLAIALVVGVAPSAQSQSDPWEAIDTASGASLRGIAPIDRADAWVTGSKGTVLHTTDAGQTWKQAKLDGLENVEIRSIHAWSDHRTVVIATAGQPAVLLKTTDAGAVWNKVYENQSPQAFFDGLRFWNDRDGIAFSDPIDGKLLVVVSHDAGETWHEIATDRIPPLTQGEAGFAASNSSLFVAGDRFAWIGLGGGAPGIARVLRTEDQGETWSVANATPIPKSEAAGIFSLGFQSDRIGVAVGGDFKKESSPTGNIAVTIDGGQRWSSPTGTGPRGYRSSVIAIPDADGVIWLACGPSGCEASRDAQNWVPFSDTGFHALGVAPDRSIWAVGSKGRVSRTTRAAVEAILK